MQTIEQALAEQLAVRVSKEIDLGALAKKLAPQIEKKITKTLMDFMGDPDSLENWILEDPKASKALSEMVIRAMAKLK